MSELRSVKRLLHDGVRAGTTTERIPLRRCPRSDIHDHWIVLFEHQVFRAEHLTFKQKHPMVVVRPPRHHAPEIRLASTSRLLRAAGGSHRSRRVRFLARVGAGDVGEAACWEGFRRGTVRRTCWPHNGRTSLSPEEGGTVKGRCGGEGRKPGDSCVPVDSTEKKESSSYYKRPSQVSRPVQGRVRILARVGAGDVLGWSTGWR